MERYHIYKLGLAILFYAVYCRRPIFANGLEVDEVIQNANNGTGALGDDENNYVYYQGVQGTPGVDFPVYSSIPRTTFTCRDVESGYYADLETDCQVFHICNEGRKISFLCPNGTVFQQSDLICEWWFKVNCTNSPNLYEESAEQLREDLLRRKASRRVPLLNHGAVLRMEERKSVSSSMQVSIHKNQKINEPSTSNRNYVETNNNNSKQKVVQNIAPLSNIESPKLSNSNNLNSRQQNSRSDTLSAQPSTYSRGGVKYNNGNINYNNVRQNQNYESSPSVNKFETNTPQKSTTGINQNSNRDFNKQNSFNNKQQGKAEIVPAKFEYEYTVSGQNSNVANARIVETQQKTSTNTSQQNFNSFTVPQSFFEGNTNEKTNNQQTNRNSQRTKPPQNFNNNAYAKINYNSKNNVNNNQKTNVKQQSTVPLRLNDIRLRKIAPNESGESQITEETASFYKNTLNSIQQASKQNSNPYPNHRETYSEIKDPNVFYGKSEPNKYFSTTISSHSTQPINNGQPFVGSMFNSDSNRQSTGYASSAKTVETKSRLNVEVEKNQLSTTARSVDSTAKTFIYCCSVTKNRNQETKNSTNTTRTGKNSNLAYTGEEYVNITVPRYSTGYVKVGSNKPNRITFTSNQNRSGRVKSGGIVAQTSRPDTNPADTTTDAFITTTKKYIPVLSEKFNVNTSKSSNVSQKVPSRSDNQRITFKLTTGLNSNNQLNNQKIIATHFNNQKLYTSSPPLQSDRSSSAKNLEFSGKQSTATPPGIFNRISNFQTRPLPFSGTFNIPTPSVQLLSPKSSDAPFVSTTQKVDVPATSKNGGFFVTKSQANGNIFTGSTGYVNTYIPTVPTVVPKNVVLRPKPFALPTTESYVSNTVFPSTSTTTLRSVEKYSTSLSTESPNSIATLPERPVYRLSSASPFSFANKARVSISPPSTPMPTQPTIFTTPQPPSSVYENVDNMIDALMKIATSKSNEEKKEDNTNETPRPGLIIPPSAGPQTLHTLAVYFANALDGIAANKTDNNDTFLENLTTEQTGDARAINSLLTSTTVNKYNDLFKDKQENVTVVSRSSPSDSGTNDLEGQNSKNPIQTTPRVRQLARVFTQALSAYLDDPDTFKKVLEEVRPTEPPPLDDDPSAGEEDEVLSFSDADVKIKRPPIYPTTPNVPLASPTWGYLLALNSSKVNNFEVKNSIGGEKENLQGADSQSFVPKFNSVGVTQKIQRTTPSPVTFTAKPFSINNDEDARFTALPVDHWTTSPDVARLWQTTLSVNPIAINSKLDATESPVESTTVEYESTLDDTTLTTIGEIKYDLRSLPKIELNATQVHGLLIDIMNTSDSGESQKLQRILRRLNTTENEFLTKMKEIESNPLTRRLILLLISECGVNATKEAEAQTSAPPHTKKRDSQISTRVEENLQTSSSNSHALAKSNSDIKRLVDPSLDDDDQDTRALQLLNSLYAIASRWGK